jgi:branched-chain amino acid transport system substrate-binding protein
MSMNRRNRFLPVIVIGLVGLIATSCGSSQTTGNISVDDPWGVVVYSPGEKIRIGIAISNAGEAEGLELMRGVDLAIEQHKNVGDFIVETTKVNLGCSQAGGEAAATELASDNNVIAVIGPDCSDACQAAMPIFANVHYTAISPTCGASILTDSVTHSSSFTRTMYRDTAEGYLAAEYAYLELGARHAVIVNDGTINTTDLATAFLNQLTSLGGKVITQVTIAPGQTDIGAVLGSIVEADPDVIYAPLMPAEAATLLNQRQQEGSLALVPIVGGRSYWGSWLIQATKGSNEGVYAVGPYIATAAYEQTSTVYEYRYGQGPGSVLYAYAYDAASILIEALNRAAASDAQGNLIIGRQELQKAIYSTAGYPGLTGSLTCTAWGDCSSESLAVGQVQSSKWVVVYIP